MATNDNLFINEEELYEICNSMYSYSNEIEVKITKYIQIMNNIKTNAIKSGKTSSNLWAYNNSLNNIKCQTNVISQQVKKITMEYLKKVDTDDKYVF